MKRLLWMAAVAALLPGWLWRNTKRQLAWATIWALSTASRLQCRWTGGHEFRVIKDYGEDGCHAHVHLCKAACVKCDHVCIAEVVKARSGILRVVRVR